MTARLIADLLQLPEGHAVPMRGGASAKRFFRLVGTPARIAMVFDNVESFHEYIDVHECLNTSGIPVPRMDRVIDDYFLIVLEDIGEHSLEKMMADQEATCHGIYTEVVDTVLHLQRITRPSPAHRRAFDREKYSFEFEFHVLDHLIGTHFGFPLRTADRRILEDFHVQLIDPLIEQPYVLVHRDLQSSNILIRNGHPLLIDFQDARMGNPWYDLASLLEDAYVNIPEVWKAEWLSRFASAAGLPFSQRLYDHTVIQRKLHDAGAFARCYHTLGNPSYLKYIKPVFLHAVNVMKRYESWASATRVFDRIFRHGHR